MDIVESVKRYDARNADAGLQDQPSFVHNASRTNVLSCLAEPLWTNPAHTNAKNIVVNGSVIDMCRKDIIIADNMNVLHWDVLIVHTLTTAGSTSRFKNQIAFESVSCSHFFPMCWILHRTVDSL